MNEGERIPFELTWYPSLHDEPSPANVIACDSEHAETGGKNGLDRCSYQGQVAGCCNAFADHAESPDFSAHGRNRRRAHDFAAGMFGRRTELGLSLLLGPRCHTYPALLVNAGYHDEALAWREWLLRAVAGSPSDSISSTACAVNADSPKLELPWLPGYEASIPVRTGNAAYKQFQLDIFGEIADTLLPISAGGTRTAAGRRQRRCRDVLAFLETGWEQPDDGIWEMRGPRRISFTRR